MEFNVDTFKALGSKTRLSLIKHLSRRRMTLSELSKCTGLHVSSVKEHLDMLEGAGIVVRHDEGQKWKYYSLTPAARRSFSNPVEINLVLPAGVLLMLSGFVSYSYDALLRGPGVMSDSAMGKGVAEGIVAAENVMITSPVLADAGTASVLSGVPLLSLVLVLLGVFLVGIFIGLKIRENRIGS